MAVERTLIAKGTKAAKAAPQTPDARRAKTVTPANILGPRLLFIITTTALVIFGLVMVYSASFVEAFTNPDIQESSYIFKHQLLLVGVGIVALLATLSIDYRMWNSVISWIPWAIIFVLLILTLVMGNEELGGKRWFDLFGFSLQPSEFAKIALLLVAAMLLCKWRTGGDLNRLATLAAAAISLPILFILLQPDLGTALIALMGIVAVAWFGELSMKPLAVIVLVIAAIAAGAILIAGFRMGRIDAWLDPWAYASDEGYQIVNSFYALADGGVSGVGLGMSHQKYLYLPQPHNDLIFPIIGEELGLIGAVSVVLLFLLFLFAAYRIAHYAPDLHGRVIAGAAASMIGVQAFLNMLCMVNLLPMTGKPLPFFSAGGSSIIVTLMLVGLVINVSLRSTVPDEATERRDQLLIIEGGRAAMPGVGQSLAERWARWQPARAQGTRAQETQMPGAKTPGAKRGFRKPPAPTQAAGKQPSRAAPARKGKPVAQPPRTQASHAQTSHAQTSHAQMPSRRARSPIYNPVRDSVPPAGVDARRPVVVNSQRSRYR